MPKPFPEHVQRIVRRWLKLGLGTTWVVAVSGGSDSVGMLRILDSLAPKMGLTLTVAHLNHGARGIESDSDAAFVADLAESLGLAFDLGQWLSTRPGHFESDARSARYAFLADTAGTRKANAVALGHNRDDQAETVLHRVVRGTGIHGLAGIPACRRLEPGLTIVRPLLTCSRETIRDYLATIHQPFRDDATNAELTRTRTRIRHDLLPKLAADYNPNVADALLRLSKIASAASRTVRKLIRETDLATDLPDGCAFKRDRLADLPVYLRAEVIRLGWRRKGWPEAGMNATRWERVARLAVLQKPGKFDVRAGVVAFTDGAVFTLRRITTSENVAKLRPVGLSIPGRVEWRDGIIHITLDTDILGDETIDLDRISPPLIVRAPEPGDRFEPLGMSGNATPLNDFFRGRRVPKSERSTTPLLCDTNGIVWVPGHRIAERVKIRETTQVRAILRWEPQRGPT